MLYVKFNGIPTLIVDDSYSLTESLIEKGLISDPCDVDDNSESVYSDFEDVPEPDSYYPDPEEDEDFDEDDDVFEESCSEEDEDAEKKKIFEERINNPSICLAPNLYDQVKNSYPEEDDFLYDYVFGNPKTPEEKKTAILATYSESFIDIAIQCNCMVFDADETRIRAVVKPAGEIKGCDEYDLDGEFDFDGDIWNTEYSIDDFVEKLKKHGN